MGLYIFNADGYFRARGSCREADLPQPKNGEAQCYIVPASADMEPIPYRARCDLRVVIAAEFAATGQSYLQVEEWVDYYAGSWRDHEGAVAAIKKQLTAIGARGVGLARMFGEAA